MRFVLRPGTSRTAKADPTLLATLGLPGGGVVKVGKTHVRVTPAEMSRLNELEIPPSAFGNGAGALVLEAELHPGTIQDPGVHITCLRSDGRYRDKLFVDGGPSTTQTTGHLRMHGREVFRHAVVKTAEVINESLQLTGLSADDIDWFVPHQANKRILDSTARKVGLPSQKVVVTVERHANTSSASIPLALDEAVKDRRIRPNQLLLLEAMGGGFTWGSAILRW